MLFKKKPVIFLAFASDLESEKDKLPHLELEKEAIKNALKNASTWQSETEKLSKQSLAKALKRQINNLAIFHFAGHATGENLILSEAERLSIDDLAPALKTAKKLELVFLNGCATYEQVEVLHNAGVKNVIATSKNIKDESASEFAKAFYEALAKGESIAEAFDTAKNFHNISKSESIEIRELEEQNTMRLPWGLYPHPNNPQASDWKLPEKQILTEEYYPKKLTVIPNKPTMIGRQEDLKNVKNLFEKEKKKIVVQGLGGLGKTTFAKAFLHQYEKEYKYIIYLEGIGNKSLAETFTKNKVLLDNVQVADFELIQNKLQNISGKKLLIIDDIPENWNMNELQLNAWDILLTSRNQITGFEMYALPNISNKEALELFKNHYSREEKLSLKELKPFFSTIQNHPLTIEIFAKTLENHISETFQNFYKKFEAEGIILQNTPDIEVGENYSKIQGKTTIEKTLKFLFDVSNLNENELWLLKQFLVLPKMLISFKELEVLYKIDDYENTDWSNLIYNLSRKGWLNYGHNHLNLHTLLREIFNDLLGIEQKDYDDLRKGLQKYLSIERDNDFDEFIYRLLLNLLDTTWISVPENALIQTRLAQQFLIREKYDLAFILSEDVMFYRMDNLETHEEHLATDIYTFSSASLYLKHYKMAFRVLKILINSRFNDFFENESQYYDDLKNFDILMLKNYFQGIFYNFFLMNAYQENYKDATKALLMFLNAKYAFIDLKVDRVVSGDKLYDDTVIVYENIMVENEMYFEVEIMDFLENRLKKSKNKDEKYYQLKLLLALKQESKTAVYQAIKLYEKKSSEKELNLDYLKFFFEKYLYFPSPKMYLTKLWNDNF